MIFLMDLAFAAELIALGVGVALLVWAYRNEGAGVGVSRVFGYIITIAAVLSALCTTYYGLNYWAKGYFKSPTAPMMMMMKRQMMQQCPMMHQNKKHAADNQHQHSEQ